MVWPFLYYPGDRLSATELAAARLDGDIVEIGDAFMPADAVETAELRAASLRALLGDTLAATHETAAWIHGILPCPPPRHRVQRCLGRRLPLVLDPRVRYRDVALPMPHVVRLGRVLVTHPVRTFCDLLREQVGHGELAALDRLVAAWTDGDPGIADRALAALREGTALHHARDAIAFLAARPVGGDPASPAAIRTS